MEKQDTGKFRTNEKDQFYTSSAVAKACIETVLKELPYTRKAFWIEPSAGAGAFLKELPADIKRLGLDIEPKAPEIQTADFLTWQAPQRPAVYFGNPPFGRQGSLARKFLEKAGKLAQVMAFILPRSFMKPSMQTSIPPLFHLVLSKELEKNSFVVNGEPYDVPCVFQIWERRSGPRPVEAKVDAVGYSYLKAEKREDWHIAVRRVGGLAGRAFLPGDNQTLAAQSHYFIKFDPPLTQEKVADIQKKLCSHSFPSNTTGPRSLSQSEVNAVLVPLLTIADTARASA
jgi:hypothetical protein